MLSFAQKLGYVLSLLLLGIAWVGALSTGPVVPFVVAVLPLTVATTGVAFRLISFIRFVHPAEFLLLNEFGIRWEVQGRIPVTVRWSDVEAVRIVSWFDWIALRINGRPRIRYVPARFRPRSLTVCEFGQILRDYWLQYRNRNGDAANSRDGSRSGR